MLKGLEQQDGAAIASGGDDTDESDTSEGDADEGDTNGDDTDRCYTGGVDTEGCDSGDETNFYPDQAKEDNPIPGFQHLTSQSRHWPDPGSFPGQLSSYRYLRLKLLSQELPATCEPQCVNCGTQSKIWTQTMFTLCQGSKW